jgi:ATP-dependent Clp protease ATP-binding subunit ClpA
MAETLAGAIAKTAGTDCDYLRLDMAEFQERHTVSKLLGAPPGYVGFGEDPQILRALRTGGRAVVLIDEIEKAHPDVFLALMNLMDAGRITPASGEAIDARHAILVFTTNLAVEVIRSVLSQASNLEPVSRDTAVRAALRSHGIAPELVGRLHELLVFDDLGQEHLDALIARSVEREGRTFGLEVLKVAPEVIEALRCHRSDPGSGARAWEHLICVDIGPAFLDARRRGITGMVSIKGDPITVEPETVMTETARSDVQ